MWRGRRRPSSSAGTSRRESEFGASGVLTTRTYEKDGQKRKATELRCDQVFFGDSKPEDGQPVPQPSGGDTFQEMMADGDDDLPF